jgi:2-keto-4-pentenoate hydratase/2-oxohepta-3-ene-1,7-dioic acid hydratase in catechol pathway
MRIASWSWGGRQHVGIVSPDGREVTPLAVPDASRGALPLIRAQAHGEALPPAAGARLAIDAVTLAAPLPRPLRSLFCVGRNYRSHAAELATTVFRDVLPEEDRWPIVFTKLGDCVVGPYDAVRLPGAAVTAQIDYESELAVVIGRGGRDIAASRAMDHVFGYTVVNDVSARDVQVRHKQWDLGKSFDTFCPMGPCIVTADEFGEPGGHRLSLKVNGRIRQDSDTADLYFSVPQLIASLSAALTLDPGDVIATGTPSGVAQGMNPPGWLQVGDVMEAEVAGIGVLRNKIVD